jgi:hypothetical protein
MWAVIDMTWTRDLAVWIRNRRVLEIMAGRGWLAKALALHGIQIVATDNGAWSSSYANRSPVFEVNRFEALAAIETFDHGADILLVSWPPYGDTTIGRAAEIWGSDRPIIYIGENCGGRNVPEEFFEYFNVLEGLSFPLKSWYGFHDNVLVGYYRITSSERS